MSPYIKAAVCTLLVVVGFWQLLVFGSHHPDGSIIVIGWIAKVGGVLFICGVLFGTFLLAFMPVKTPMET